MPMPLADLKSLVQENMPEDGSAIGNQALLAVLQKAAPEIGEADYQAAREALIAEGKIEKGRGRGGSVLLVLDADDGEDDEAEGDEGEFALDIQDELNRVSVAFFCSPLHTIRNYEKQSVK
jgi:adenine-specific DNA-methyltransferase